MQEVGARDPDDTLINPTYHMYSKTNKPKCLNISEVVWHPVSSVRYDTGK